MNNTMNIARPKSRNVAVAGGPEAPTCPKCERPMMILKGPFGLFANCKRDGLRASPDRKNGGWKPATDQRTRNSRKMAHDAFDSLWQSGKMRRTEAYVKLSEFLGIPEAHIGDMGPTDCRRVVQFAQKNGWRHPNDTPAARRARRNDREDRRDRFQLPEPNVFYSPWDE